MGNEFDWLDPNEQRPSFLDSPAWQRALTLSEAVYVATRDFPREELFGLTNQLRRAAVSIPSNIAEGKGRLTSRELLQFLCIARGSTQEVVTQLIIARRRHYGNDDEFRETLKLAAEVLKILNASISTLRAQTRRSI